MSARRHGGVWTPRHGLPLRLGSLSRPQRDGVVPQAWRFRPRGVCHCSTCGQVCTMCPARSGLRAGTRASCSASSHRWVSKKLRVLRVCWPYLPAGAGLWHATDAIDYDWEGEREVLCGQRVDKCGTRHPALDGWLYFLKRPSLGIDAQVSPSHVDDDAAGEGRSSCSGHTRPSDQSGSQRDRVRGTRDIRSCRGRRVSALPKPVPQ
jgi:hypothetical protein